ncbi:hypothetical protein D6764_05020, partial [Candidatus Woesearchaeota archaeon]
MERIYNVPLRKEFQKAPIHKRTPKAVKALREFMQKHMKSDTIIIGSHLNELLWKNGIKNPPHHVKVKAVKDDAGKVTVELADLPTSKTEETKKESGKDKKAEQKTEKAKTDSKPAKKEEKEEKPAESSDKPDKKPKEE